MIIRIKNNQKAVKLSTAKLKARLSIMLETLDLPDAELSVLFTGDRAMRKHNRQFRNKDATTDVLSFSLRDGGFPKVQPDMLGDIVISIPAARRQAVDAGHALIRELERLLIHGLLHLHGYDHERSLRDAKTMRRMERRMLKRLSA